MERRKFIKQIGIGTAGITMLNWMDLSAAYLPSNISLSMGGLTNFILIDDCARLAITGGLVTKKIQNYINADISKPLPANISRMGGIVNADVNEIIEELVKAEPNFIKSKNELNELPTDASSKKREELEDKVVAAERRIALLLGWFMASGIHRYISPLYGQNNNDNLEMPNEMKIYHDMYVLRKRAMSSADTDVNDVSSLFNGLLPRMICRTHTMTPDYDDGFEWTVRISDWRDKNVALMNKYAEVFVKPDQSKIEKYILSNKFYDSSDELISLAEALDSNNRIGPSNIRSAISEDHERSLYEKALKVGLNNLKSAGEFMEGKITKNALKNSISKS